jgi:hypothetical protein
MYLTDFRENTLQDVIAKLEPDLFIAVTGRQQSTTKRSLSEAND